MLESRGRRRAAEAAVTLAASVPAQARRLTETPEGESLVAETVASAIDTYRTAMDRLDLKGGAL